MNCNNLNATKAKGNMQPTDGTEHEKKPDISFYSLDSYQFCGALILYEY